MSSAVELSALAFRGPSPSDRQGGFGMQAVLFLRMLAHADAVCALKIQRLRQRSSAALLTDLQDSKTANKSAAQDVHYAARSHFSRCLGDESIDFDAAPGYIFGGEATGFVKARSPQEFINASRLDDR